MQRFLLSQPQSRLINAAYGAIIVAKGQLKSYPRKLSLMGSIGIITPAVAEYLYRIAYTILQQIRTINERSQLHQNLKSSKLANVPFII